MTLRLALRGSLVLLLFVAGAAPWERKAGPGADDFLMEAAHRWCGAHGKREDLQAVLTEVHFRAEPPLFVVGEGAVVAPVAVDLPGAQRVLDVVSRPEHLRKLEVEGTTALAWAYGGRIHRDMRFAGVALVERAPSARVPPPEEASFDRLPAELRPDAMARAADLEEHNLNKCAAFGAWAQSSAGAGPYTDQIVRLAHAVEKRFEGNQQRAEDVCAALRQGRFTPHWAQVLVVMGAREVGAPAFGFASAAPRQTHLVGTYTDKAGWIFLDVERPSDGWFTGGSPLVTKAPLLGGFKASAHDLWYPEGGAYAQSPFGVQSLSGTDWRGGLAANAPPTDTTEARSVRLSEVCR